MQNAITEQITGPAARTIRLFPRATSSIGCYHFAAMVTIHTRRAGYYLAAIAILALALTLRLHGHDRDDRQFRHPDKRVVTSVLVDRIHIPSLAIASAVVDPSHTPVNGGANGTDDTLASFAYGSLPLFYVTVFVAWVRGSLTDQHLKTYTHIVSIGRNLGTLLDVGNLLLATLFAKRTFGTLTAFITGVLLARGLSHTFIQLPRRLLMIGTAVVIVTGAVIVTVKPAASTTSSDHWGGQLPHLLSGSPENGPYRHLSLDFYVDSNREQAISYVNDPLQQADIIVGPFQIDTYSAGDSFTIYDQPRVRIFQTAETFTSGGQDQRFAWATNQPSSPSHSPEDALLLSGLPSSVLPVATDSGWSSAITARAPMAILAWVGMLAALAAVTVPVTFVLFRGFGDLGWGFARLTGLVVSGYAVWIAVSLGAARFTLGWIAGIVAVVAIVVWVVARGRIKTMRAEILTHWRLILASESVFLAAFGFLLFLRALHPDLWQTTLGGEKPMEMAFTSAIGRSATFPPYDPWYAGGFINYYYYGFYLFALLWKLCGVPAEIGFQLGIATIGATLVSGMFSLASTLTTDFLSTKRFVWAITGGLIGVVLYSIIGNLDATIQVLARHTTAIDFWQSSRVVDGAITEFPYFTLIWADLHPHAIALPITVLLIALTYAWLRSTPGEIPARLWLPAAGLLLGTLLAVNPWDMPLAALIVGAGFLTRVRRKPASVRTYVVAVLTWATTLAISGLLFLPFLSHYESMVGGVGLTSQGTRLNQYLRHFGILLGILTVAGAAWLGRRSILTGLPGARFAAAGALTALGGFAVSSLFLTSPGTNFETMVLTGTIVLALATAFPAIVSAVLADDRRRSQLSAASVAIMMVVGLLAPYRLTASLLLFPLFLGILLWLRCPERPAVTFFSLCLTGAAGVTLGTDLVFVIDDLRGSIWERMNTVFKFYLQGWTLYAIAATVALVWLLQRAIRENVAHRLPFVGQPSQAHERPYDSTSTARDRYPLAPAALSVAMVLIIAGLAYPLFGTGQRLAQRMSGSPEGLTLDGLAWMRGSTITNAFGEQIEFAGDYDAIVWLRGHTEGNPVILEASIGPYRGNGSRISAATGLPTVLGWDRHERQQRYASGIDQRLHDVREIYRTPSIERKRHLLKSYNVRYVVVGDVERLWTIKPPFAGATNTYEHYASPEGLGAFDRMTGTDLRVAFRSGHTTVYEVIPFPALPLDPATGASS